MNRCGKLNRSPRLRQNTMAEAWWDWDWPAMRPVLRVSRLRLCFERLPDPVWELRFMPASGQGQNRSAQPSLILAHHASATASAFWKILISLRWRGSAGRSSRFASRAIWIPGSFPPSRAHPLSEMIGNGLLVTLNSDDPSICGTTLSREYSLAHIEQGLTEETIHRLILRALDAGFLSEGKAVLKRQLAEGVAGAVPLAASIPALQYSFGR